MNSNKKRFGLKPGLLLWEHSTGTWVRRAWVSTSSFPEGWKNQGHFKTKCLVPLPAWYAWGFGWEWTFSVHGAFCSNPVGPSGTLKTSQQLDLRMAIQFPQPGATTDSWCRCNSHMEEKLNCIGGCLFEKYAPFNILYHSTYQVIFSPKIWKSKPLTRFCFLSLSMSGSSRSNIYYYDNAEHGDCTLTKVEDAGVSFKTLRRK